LKENIYLGLIKNGETGRVRKQGALNEILQTTVSVPVKSVLSINELPPVTLKDI
jgi:hypothetical protein